MSIASSRPSSQVADCFPAREIHLIGGASGVGKTSVACHLLHDAAHSGGHFFGYPINITQWWYVYADRPRNTVLATAKRPGCCVRIITTAGRLKTQVSHQASAQPAAP
jgi:KaiC/GvpD/RAD55 family RecA-like ATPase